MCVHTFKHEYLRNQRADRCQILSEASLGWGKVCIRFWANRFGTLVYTATDSNGPINVHLISGPTVSTKTSKIGQGQPSVIIYIKFVELESQTLQAKFQDHRTSGSGDFFVVFTIYGHGGHQ